MAMDVLEIETPHGPARAHLERRRRPRAAVVLGHGAGGGIGARDLTAAAGAAKQAGCSIALVEQPYRVAGKRSQPAAPRLDEAWTAVVDHLRAGPLRRTPLVTGGRSAGARVACRTAAATGAVGVLCLAFPLSPPRRSPTTPPRSRQDELDAVTVPVLVVQGTGDPFGMPEPSPTRDVVQVRGTHSLSSDLDQVASAIEHWLERVLS
jgi:uncharacterized protein